MVQCVSKMKMVTVIIPTIYSSDFTRLERAIHTVETAMKEAHDVGLKIIAVYNSAPEDIQEDILKRKLERLCDLSIAVLINHINKGFAPAVNDGILYARATVKPDWYLVLNDDAYIDKDFFVRLMPQIRSDTYDAVSCGINTLTGERESVGLLYSSAGIAFPRRREISEKETRLFSGTCVLLSGTLVENELKRHGYVFNPHFFAYAEDLELSLRILHDGGKIYISNNALVVHEGSQTAKRGSFFQLYHGYRNLVLVVLLMWPWSTIFWRLPLLMIGQAYMFAMTVYKGYWLLYPKLWWWVGKRRNSILWQRRSYDT